MTSEDECDRVPLLYLDVNLGKGVVKRVVLFAGDEPEDVAAEFVAENCKDPC